MLSLSTDSDMRKTIPLCGGLLGYFGAALAGVAHHSWMSNEKHNPGEPVHWSMSKSADHADCIMRHLLDVHELMAADASPKEILEEANALAWRALALSQTLWMKYGEVPIPFNATED